MCDPGARVARKYCGVGRRACAPWDCVLLLFWDMVGLTFVRVAATGVEAGAAGAAGCEGSALAATGRFGEVFSKLRAGTVALCGGGEDAPRPLPLCGAGWLFLGTRC